MKSIVTITFVNKGEIHEVASFPKTALNTVITKRAPYEPKKTMIGEYLNAITIARKKVLSPISLTKIVKKDVVNPVSREPVLGISSANLMMYVSKSELFIKAGTTKSITTKLQYIYNNKPNQ